MIRRMMEESRRAIVGGGAHYVLWGVVVISGLLVTFAAIERGSPDWAGVVWPIAIAAGWIGSIVIGRTADRCAPVSSPATRFLAAVWIGVGVTLTILGLLGPTVGAVAPGALSGVIACVIGAGYFASSFVYVAGWVRALAGAWWAGGIVMLVWPGSHTLLVMAAMVLAFQVAPGLVLLRRARGVGTRAD